jgi:hypothetical protein
MTAAQWTPPGAETEETSNLIPTVVGIGVVALAAIGLSLLK